MLKHTFNEHLADVFHLHPSQSEPKEEKALIQLLEAPYQLEPTNQSSQKS
jgi:hypothetical protein